MLQDPHLLISSRPAQHLNLTQILHTCSEPLTKKICEHESEKPGLAHRRCQEGLRESVTLTTLDCGEGD